MGRQPLVLVAVESGSLRLAVERTQSLRTQGWEAYARQRRRSGI